MLDLKGQTCSSVSIFVLFSFCFPYKLVNTCIHCIWSDFSTGFKCMQGNQYFGWSVPNLISGFGQHYVTKVNFFQVSCLPLLHSYFNIINFKFLSLISLHINHFYTHLTSIRRHTSIAVAMLHGLKESPYDTMAA